MLHLNVRSLNQNFESLKELLTTIKFEFKVICFTETWRTDDPRNETFNLESCTSINQVRKHEYASLFSILWDLNQGLTYHRDSKLKKSKNVVISAQYRQPAGAFKQYKAYLENFFNKMKNYNKDIYIVGDTNLNLSDYETIIKVKNQLNFLFQKSFIPS